MTYDSQNSPISRLWNDPITILYMLIGFLVANSLWAVYLLIREVLAVRACRNMPAVLNPYLMQRTFLHMRSHRLQQTIVSTVNVLIFVMLIGCLELYFGLYAFLWDVATKVARYNWMKNEGVKSIIFWLLLTSYFALKALPCSLYDAFCMPSRHMGVNEQKFTGGQVCQLVLTALLVSGAILLIVYVVQQLEQYACVALFLVAMALLCVTMLVFPLLIDPLMGTRVPLANGALKRDLEHLTAHVGFPMERVYIIRLHEPTANSNAFFTGSCCLKRIVIFENLIQGYTPAARGEPLKGLASAQLVAVVAHELGHWCYHHFYKSVTIMALQQLLCCALYGLCYAHGPIYQAVGFKPGIKPVLAGLLIIFNIVLLPLMTLVGFVKLSASRYFEYQADEYAFELGYGLNLQKALLKIYADNLAFPISDSLYSKWHHTHPTMMDRLQRLQYLRTGSAL